MTILNRVTFSKLKSKTCADFLFSEKNTETQLGGTVRGYCSQGIWMQVRPNMVEVVKSGQILDLVQDLLKNWKGKNKGER